MARNAALPQRIGMGHVNGGMVSALAGTIAKCNNL
jgi:hypothetical protein